MIQYTDGAMLSKIYRKQEKYLVLVFAIYCIVLVYVTLFRTITSIGLSGYLEKFSVLGSFGFMTYGEQLRMNSNIIPLFSFYAFITAPYKSAILVRTFLVNIVGNLLLFFPWGILFPVVNSKAKNFKYFFVFTTIVIVIIELLQLFALLGAFDVEDYLLNIIGASAGFVINKYVRKKTLR